MLQKLSPRISTSLAVSLPLVLLLMAWQTGSKQATAAQPSRSGNPPKLGDPLPNLTPAQLAAFTVGKADFAATEDIGDGLGPVFNGTSCAECHSKTAVGGAGFDLELTRVTMFGRYVNAQFDPMVNRGGQVIQRRSVAEFDPTLPVAPEVVPPEATVVSHRITTPLFGLGLIEAISENEIRRGEDPNDRNRDGISGRVNPVFNPENGRTEVGRFGWKAMVSSIHVFAGLAYRNEMGIRNPLFPDENLPQGQVIPPGLDPVPGLEDDGTSTGNFTAFMRLLAAPEPVAHPTDQAIAGERVFAQVGCVLCHTPELHTSSTTDIAALRSRSVRLYSDLLLHDMGPGLDDKMPMESATGSEWRTAPLWGVSRRSFLLHDGRAQSFDSAISAHGGEAAGVVNRFAHLSRRDHDALMAFLSSL